MFTSQLGFAQDSIYGKIYGDNGVAEYVKVLNAKTNTTTFSDENGNFSLKASIGDSVIFSSSFYEKKKLVINSTHFSEAFIVQLKDNINQLDEVVLKDLVKKEFNAKTYNKKLGVFIKDDVKNKPWFYEPAPPAENGINLKGFKYLKNLLFPKEKKEIKILEPITYEDLKKLNKEDAFFNDLFFIKDLKIPKDYKNIFFEYIDDQEISSGLLSAENRLLLIDTFFKLSNTFLARLNEVKMPDKKPAIDLIKNTTYDKNK